jgi:hypothetical protein
LPVAQHAAISSADPSLPAAAHALVLRVRGTPPTSQAQRSMPYFGAGIVVRSLRLDQQLGQDHSSA